MSAVPAPGFPSTLAASFQLENAVAELDRFDRLLRASGSATAMLTEWMREKNGRPSICITARRVGNRQPTPPPPWLMSRLAVDSAEQLRFRRVRLTVGSRILSDARNWYVPARLTQTMRDLIDKTQTPFGTAIAPLSPVRETILAERYWPERHASVDADASGKGAALPARLLRHDALVRNGDGLPLCWVSETYTRNILL